MKKNGHTLAINIQMHLSLQDELKVLDEIVAKRNKKGKKVEEKPAEEKSIMHCKYHFIFTFLFLVNEWCLVAH